jgi:hypothetical protein
VSAALVAWSCAAAEGGAGLVLNGSFDNATNGLFGWKYVYELPGEDWYFGNHKHVSVEDQESGRGKVLRLEGNASLLGNQGVQVDSTPIPCKPIDRFRLSLWARSSGPNCRILVEGYQWKPGIKPHPDPALHELRKCYKFSQVYFGSQQAGEMGGVTRAWQKGTITFPDKAFASSPLAQSLLKKMQFVVIHIVAIGGSPGSLYVDDVTLDKLTP